MVHAALLLLMLEVVTRTSFHHQPEAQHPKSPAIYTPAGRLPHLFPDSCQNVAAPRIDAKCQYRKSLASLDNFVGAIDARAMRRCAALRPPLKAAPLWFRFSVRARATLGRAPYSRSRTRRIHTAPRACR